MHIKKLIVEGFRSYKDRTIIELDPRHNVVVGKNGSGKSNVFVAIQFVLSDTFSSLRQEERQRLLHEGSGRAVMTAYVEIIFDNRDMRFPLEEHEVSLKRSIGVKKDEYFLNSKHTTKSDVESLLESAGLSRSNPYYIVQQGKVNHIIKMKDSQRLDLLKEIAGTRVYDDRRKESMKIMAETTYRRDQIQEIISYIENRMEELEDESAELKEFQEKDKERRCLEYTIYNKESQNAEKKLAELEEFRKNATDEGGDVHSEAVRVREERKGAESELADLETDIKNFELEKAKIVKEKRTAYKRQSKLDYQVKDISQKSKADDENRATWQTQLEELEKKIDVEEGKLKNCTGDFDAKVTEEQKVQEDLASKEARLQDLYAKQGRSNQFSSKAQRDKYLNKEIKSLKRSLKAEQKQQTALEKDISASKDAIDQQTQIIGTTQQQVEDIKKRIRDMTERYNETRKSRDSATEKRKELWRKERDFENERKDVQNNHKKAQHDLESTMSKRHYRGIRGVKRVVEENGIRGYYGILADIFKVKHGDKFIKCVETVAKNRLFYHVVDTDETASKILKYLEREKIGRVTFMPLNRLASNDQDYPAHTDIIPVMNVIEFNDMFRKAMLQIFGRTMVARTLTIGTQFSRNYNFDIVTLEGDQAFRKGTLSGGHNEFRRSRLQALSGIRTASERLEELDKHAGERKQAVSQEDQNVNSAIGSLSKLEAEKRHERRLLAQKLDEIRFAETEKATFEKNLAGLESALKKTERIVQSVQQKISSFEEELQSELRDDLNTQESDEVHQLNEVISALKQELAQISSARAKIELQKNKLENSLNINLLKTKTELESNLNKVSEEEDTEHLDRLDHELQLIGETIADLESSESDIEKQLDRKNNRSRTLQTSLEKLKDQENKLVRQLRDSSKTMEKLLSKRSALVEKKSDCQKKIKALGTPPQDAFERYTRHSINRLVSMLSKCNTGLKKYSHVNKKAIDQYQNFTEQRDNLMARKEEQDRGKTAIENLIEHLDQKKDEAINKTFLRIAKHFSTVFQELVPDGKGTIVMQTKGTKRKKKSSKDEDEDMEDEASSGSEGDDVHISKRYTGVGIKVSFTGSGETFSMNQLSGGQQTVVALALIFAIQRCDPSPFYLFDEIDSALDSQYRTAVANMIGRYSEEKKEGDDVTAQFITTTFRPEFLNVGNKFFTVLYQNKISKIRQATKETARSLIQQVDVAGGSG